MRKLILVLLLSPILATAQELKLGYGNPGTRDSLVRILSLPQPLYTNFYKVFKGSGSNRKFRISSDSLYRYIFEKQVDTLPPIDFTKYEIVVTASCAFCSVRKGEDGQYYRVPQHRNGCRYYYSWLLVWRKSESS